MLVGIIFLIFLTLFLSTWLFWNGRQLKIFRNKLNVVLEENVENIKEIEVLKKQIESNITLDALTGLPNQKILEDRLSQLFNRSKRYELLFAILHLDIDNFRMLSATFSKEIADQLLKGVAHRLSKSLRQVDTIARIGNDEFIILLSQISKPEMSAYVAERIRNFFLEPFIINEQKIYLTLSTGIAVFPMDGNTSHELLVHADQALQQAKKLGPNHIQFFHQELYEEKRRDLILMSSIHTINPDEDLVIYYQPQLNIHTNTIHSIATLLYWKHAEFGLIDFNEFIHYAENSGKISAVSEWLIRHAGLDFKHWASHLTEDERSLTIPVSEKQLENPHFIYKLSQLLEDVHLNPSALVLEISEISLQAKWKMIEKTLSMLKNLKINISIDNFGTGDISWRELHTFPISSLKISSSLITDIHQNQETVAIVNMMITLAKTLKIKTIAGNVLQSVQLDILKKIGCDIIQGDLIESPKLFDDFSKYIDKKQLVT